MDISVDIAAHIIISLLTAYILWNFFGKNDKKILPACFAAALLFGLLIDIDHVFDFIRTFGFIFSPSKFFFGNMFGVSGKFYIPFHGFEYVILLAFAAFFAKNNIYKLYFTIGAVAMFLHLLTDSFLYSIPPQYYFLLYRASVNFKTPFRF